MFFDGEKSIFNRSRSRRLTFNGLHIRGSIHQRLTRHRKCVH